MHKALAICYEMSSAFTSDTDTMETNHNCNYGSTNTFKATEETIYDLVCTDCICYAQTRQRQKAIGDRHLVLYALHAVFMALFLIKDRLCAACANCRVHHLGTARKLVELLVSASLVDHIYSHRALIIDRLSSVALDIFVDSQLQL